MVSVSVLSFEKFASQVLKIVSIKILKHVTKSAEKRHHMGVSQSSCPKNVTIWATRKARAPITTISHVDISCTIRTVPSSCIVRPFESYHWGKNGLTGKVIQNINELLVETLVLKGLH